MFNANTGLYQIVAAGAGYTGAGGAGAVVSTHFAIREGSSVEIAVGQQGISRGAAMTMGGAGGTFVIAANRAHAEESDVIDAEGNELMLAAGGRLALSFYFS